MSARTDLRMLLLAKLNFMQLTDGSYTPNGVSDVRFNDRHSFCKVVSQFSLASLFTLHTYGIETIT